MIGEVSVGDEVTVIGYMVQKKITGTNKITLSFRVLRTEQICMRNSTVRNLLFFLFGKSNNITVKNNPVSLDSYIPSTIPKPKLPLSVNLEKVSEYRKLIDEFCKLTTTNIY